MWWIEFLFGIAQEMMRKNDANINMKQAAVMAELSNSIDKTNNAANIIVKNRPRAAHHAGMIPL
jgi:hypothetical protein